MKETSSWNGRKILQDFDESVQKGLLEIELRENEAVDNNIIMPKKHKLNV